MISCLYFFFFFFNDTATTEIYTLSLHDALPISITIGIAFVASLAARVPAFSKVTITSTLRRTNSAAKSADRKSTRLNSSHLVISYAVFCLKKKKKHRQELS